jgi:hypothetical protein
MMEAGDPAVASNPLDRLFAAFVIDVGEHEFHARHRQRPRDRCT